MIYYLSFGLALGLAAGFSPGPLLTLVITETLTHGFSSGVRVALAPLITDFPIIIVTLLAANQLSGMDNLLGIISLTGSCYVLYMAYESAKQKDQSSSRADAKPRSLRRGVLANALSPHPYLFWLSVGAPTVATAASTSAVAPALFIGGFYVVLIGSKVVLAMLAGKSRLLLEGPAYAYAMRFLALVLAVFSALLFVDGLTLLGLYEA